MCNKIFVRFPIGIEIQIILLAEPICIGVFEDFIRMFSFSKRAAPPHLMPFGSNDWGKLIPPMRLADTNPHRPLVTSNNKSLANAMQM